MRYTDRKEPASPLMPRTATAPERPEEKESSQSAAIESRRLAADRGLDRTGSRDHLTFSANAAKKSSDAKSSAAPTQSEFRLPGPDANSMVKVQDQSDLLPPGAERASFEQASQFQAPRDTMISQHKSTLGTLSNAGGAHDQTQSINRYAASGGGAQMLQMPVTEYYLNKYGQGQSPRNFDDSGQDFAAENQLMLQARRKMQDLQMDQQS